jgi:hypothetical protein
LVLRLTPRDADVPHREIRAAGTKTSTRDRSVRVAEWAWPKVESTLLDKLPEARLFTVSDRSKASKTQKRVCGELGARRLPPS